jgi:hypothetical protein
MTPEERAEKILPCWQPTLSEKGCGCPMCVLRPQIAAAIREAVANKQCEADEREAQWCFECGLESQEKAKAEAYKDAEKIADSHGWFGTNDNVVGYEEGARDTADVIATEIRSRIKEVGK